jgi:ferrous iron transport protein A
MPDAAHAPFPLAMASEGANLRVVALRGGPGFGRRVSELGLNIGSELVVLHRQGGGLVMARGETRVAMGGGIAHKILVVHLDAT